MTDHRYEIKVWNEHTSKLEHIAEADDVGGAKLAIRQTQEDVPGRYKRKHFGIYDHKTMRWALLPAGLR